MIVSHLEEGVVFEGEKLQKSFGYLERLEIVVVVCSGNEV